MSIIGVLNRAYHNTKQSIPQDHGWAYDPFGKIVPTTYQAVARISRATKFTVEFSYGQLVLIELEDEAFPPIDLWPTGSFDRGWPSTPAGFQADRIAISGTDNFDGEHEILALDEVPKNPKRIILLDTVNPPNAALTDEIIEEDVGWCYLAPLHKGEILMDPARVISHPSFPQREGEGIYTYPFPPDITRNFIYHPATKVDGVVQRTLSSNILITSPQVDEDVVITEIWLGGDRRLSTLAEMFRVFHQYWTTPPAPGLALGWEPRDRTSDRFHVQIVRVQLGGLDYEYREVREIATRNEGAYLDRQLTLQFKLARVARPARPQIVLEGR